MARPLIVLAPPGSFGSLVCAMLGEHPHMLTPGETHLLARECYGDLEPLQRIEPRARDALVTAISKLGLGDLSPESVAAAETWLEEYRRAPTTALFADLAAWAAPRELVDSSPHYAQRLSVLRRIEAAFPRARYLHLARHPRRSCEAARKGQNAARLGVEPTPDELWLEPHLNILEFLEEVDTERHMRIRAEVLLAEPALFLPQIAEWLGIGTDNAWVASMTGPRYDVDDGGSVLEAPPIGGPDVAFSEILRQYALRFGYG